MKYLKNIETMSVNEIKNAHEKKIILAIDCDGTIVEDKFPLVGQFRPNAKEVINKLYDEGYYIIIWTCRTGKFISDIKSFFQLNGLKYHKVNENYEDLDFNPYPKIFATIYIDDRQLGGIPNDWNIIYDMIKKQQ